MGEDEHAVKKELQEKKAQANDDRKRAAGAIADAAAPKPAAKRAKTTTAGGDPVSPPLPGDHSDPTNSAYYKEVQSDNSPNFGSVSWHGVGKPIAIDK